MNLSQFKILLIILGILSGFTQAQAQEVCSYTRYQDIDADGQPEYRYVYQFDQEAPEDWRESLPAFTGNDLDEDEEFESVTTVTWEGDVATYFLDSNNNGIVDVGEDKFRYYYTQPQELLNPQSRDTFVIEYDLDADGSIDRILKYEHDIDNKLITKTTDYDNDGSIDRLEIKEEDPDHPEFFLTSSLDSDNDGIWDQISNYLWNELNDGYTFHKDNNADGIINLDDELRVVQLDDEGRKESETLDLEANGVIDTRHTYEYSKLLQIQHTDYYDDGISDVLVHYTYWEKIPSRMHEIITFDPSNGEELQRSTFDYTLCPASCGDNYTSGNEVCDGADLSGETCLTQGFSKGNLACQADCLNWDTSDCQTADTDNNNSLESGTSCSLKKAGKNNDYWAMIGFGIFLSGCFFVLKNRFNLANKAS